MVAEFSLTYYKKRQNNIYHDRFGNENVMFNALSIMNKESDNITTHT